MKKIILAILTVLFSGAFGLLLLAAICCSDSIIGVQLGILSLLFAAGANISINAIGEK